MAKKLGFIVILSMCLLIVQTSLAQEKSLSPATSPKHETFADSPLPPPESDSSPSPVSLPEADSLPPPVSSPDSPPPPPLPSQPESPSPSPGPAPVPAPSDEDSEPETEYFPSPGVEKPDDIKANEDGEEFNQEIGEDNGMSGLKKAGIAIGAILGVGATVIGALVYKKRRDNLTRARYTYFNQGEFL